MLLIMLSRSSLKSNVFSLLPDLEGIPVLHCRCWQWSGGDLHVLSSLVRFGVSSGIKLSGTVVAEMRWI